MNAIEVTQLQKAAETAVQNLTDQEKQELFQDCPTCKIKNTCEKPPAGAYRADVAFFAAKKTLEEMPENT